MDKSAVWPSCQHYYTAGRKQRLTATNNDHKKSPGAILTSRSDGPEGVAAMDGRPQKSPQAYDLWAFRFSADA